MQTTKLTAQSTLPLTCSRSGTCCFGKSIMLNPWEVFNYSKEKKISATKFRNQYCEFGGIRLKFNGKPDSKGQSSCSQYDENIGCTVHQGRGLACRLYPLGRQVQFDNAHYIYQGEKFPCLYDCSEVLKLPQLTVGEYLQGQETKNFEIAQDAYLEVMQNIADIGFELLLETGLSESGDTKTLALWRIMGKESHQDSANRIGKDWIDALMIPKIQDTTEPTHFVQQHSDLLLTKAQQEFSNLTTFQAVHKACVLIVGVALHLSRGLGADTQGISEHWIETAKSHGALE